MRRIRVALAVLAAAAFVVIVTGCGGGGGGGGTPTVTTTLTGRVVDSTGSPVQSATVSVEAATRAPVTGTTNFTGQYSISGVPVGTVNITVTKAGLATTVLNGVTVDQSAKMEIVAGGEGAPNTATVVTIEPAFANLYEGQTKEFGIVVKAGTTQLFPSVMPGWKASVSVTGAATGQISADDPTSFSVTGVTPNQNATVKVTVMRADGTPLTATATTTIKDMDAPPPPPL